MTRATGGVSRRNFLRLKPTDRGQTMELSLRAMFIHVHDAKLPRSEGAAVDRAAGDPAASDGPTLDDLLQDFARQLEGVRVLKLFEPEWLESMDEAGRVRAVLAQFEARGGRVEEQW